MSKENKLIPELRFPEFVNEGEWEEKKLGELLEFKNGINASKEQYGKGIKFINVLDILQNEFITHEKIIGSVDVDEETVDKFSVNYGDILFQRSSETQDEVGTANVYLDKNQTATFGGFVIRGKKIGEYEPIFLNKLLKSQSIRNSISSKAGGSTRFNVGQEILSSINILLPSTQEQQKIAECLSSLDEVIAAHGQKLDALKEHKKALMQNLFPQEGETVPKWRFSEFKERWIKTKLNKHIELLSGFAFQSVFFAENGKKLLTPKNFTKTGIAKFSSENTKYTTEISDEKYLCNEGDLLLLLTDLTPSCELLGKPIMLRKEDGEVLLNQRIVKIIFKWNIDKNFLLQFFLTDLYHNRIKNTASGSTVRHSSNKIILDTELFYPSSPKEQQKIAECLSSLDELINAQGEKIEALKLHKKGLMQGLFPKVKE